MVPATEMTAEDLRSSFEVNTIAPLLVFQAFWPLLQKSPTATPKTIMFSSSVGSIANQEPIIPCGAYRTSCAAGNWLTRALHVQNENLVAVALYPGWVHTRAGDFAAERWRYAPGPPDSVNDSVRGMLGVIDGATRETVSGRFVTYTGDELPW